MRIALAAMVIGIALAPCAVAAETAPPPDTYGSCSYDTPEVSPPEGTIPATQPLFTIEMHGNPIDGLMARLTRVRDGHEVPLAVFPGTPVRLAPRELLEVGATHVLTHPRCGTGPQHTTIYDVVDAPAPPSTLGTLAIHGPFVSTFGGRGACRRVTFIDVTLETDAAFAAEPWASFHWGVEIAGAPPRIATPLTMTTRRFPNACPGAPLGVAATVIEPGPTDLRGLASPSWSDTPLWTPFDTTPITIDIDCAAATWVDPDTYRPLTLREIADAQSDAGQCGMDAGAPPDASGSMDASADPTPGMHASCAASPNRASASWIVLALISLAARRGRSRVGTCRARRR